jgi:hypothetical protein
MRFFTSPNARITGPLPRRDILAICAYLNRRPDDRPADASTVDPDSLLDRLASAARMQ